MPLLPKKHFTNYIKQAFNLNKNGEELFNYSKISKTINNDLGLTYIKGIKGIAMIFLLFGFFFIQLFNSPICLNPPNISNIFIVLSALPVIKRLLSLVPT